MAQSFLHEILIHSFKDVHFVSVCKFAYVIQQRQEQSFILITSDILINDLCLILTFISPPSEC